MEKPCAEYAVFFVFLTEYIIISANTKLNDVSMTTPKILMIFFQHLPQVLGDFCGHGNSKSQHR